MASIVEQHLAGREFLVGDAASVADFIMAYTLDWADEVGLLSEFPVSRAYLLRMYARPCAPERIGVAFKRISSGAQPPPDL